MFAIGIVVQGVLKGSRQLSANPASFVCSFVARLGLCFYTVARAGGDDGYRNLLMIKTARSTSSHSCPSVTRRRVVHIAQKVTQWRDRHRHLDQCAAATVSKMRQQITVMLGDH